MNWMRTLLALLLVLLLQVSLVNRIEILGIRPDLPLLFLIFVAQRGGALTGTLVGLIAGALQDIFVPYTLGMHMFSQCIVGYSVGKVSENIVIDTPLWNVGFIAVTVLAHDLIYLLIYTRLDLARFIPIYVTNAIPTAFYSAAVGSMILVISARMQGARIFAGTGSRERG